MGCTNSTPNMPEPPSSTTDKMQNIMTNEDSEEPTEKNDIIYTIKKESEHIQVLPECEITNNVKQVVDIIKSTSDNLDMENKDVQDTTPTENHSDTAQITECSPLQDNFVSLKVVVEKVITDNCDGDEQINNITETQNTDLDRQIEEIIMESTVSEDADVELNDDEAKESPSPTQSEDSRATRWEALADIAAELPPSLAVDPLTGQIYSLAK